MFLNLNKIRPTELQRFLLFIEDNFKDIQEIRNCMERLSIEAGEISFRMFEKQFTLARRSKLPDLYNQNLHIVRIRRVRLTPSGFLFDYKQPEMTNRLIRNYIGHADNFLRLTVEDDCSERLVGNKEFLTKHFIRRMINEVTLNGRRFEFLGWSPSQLRKFSMWYIHQSKPLNLQKDQVLNFLGIFDRDATINYRLMNEDGRSEERDFTIKKLTNPAKKAARVGQCFSASKLFRLNKVNVFWGNDLKDANGKMFSDGIGMISADLALAIEEQLDLSDVCALQVRYQGAKGLLMVDRTLK